MALPDDVAFAIKTNVVVITTLSAQIDLLEKRLQERIEERPEYGLLALIFRGRFCSLYQAAILA